MANGAWKIARRSNAQLPLVIVIVLAVVLVLLGKAQSGLFDRARMRITDWMQPGLESVHAPVAAFNGQNPFGVAFSAFRRASKSMDFWLLCLTFGICGFSTNGLINTHLIAYCADNGISPMNGASILAVIGVFSLIGSTTSGWLCDRYSPRVLLFHFCRSQTNSRSPGAGRHALGGR